jgi:hypothetical protein
MHEPARPGIDPRLPTDLADALDVARAAALGSANLIATAGLPFVTQELFAPMLEATRETWRRGPLIHAALADLVPVSQPTASFGASCAHAAALAMLDQVLGYARDACKGQLDLFRSVVGAGVLNDLPDARAVVAACEREAYVAYAARGDPTPLTSDRPADAREVEGEPMGPNIDALALLTQYLVKRFRDGHLRAPYVLLRNAVVDAGCSDGRKASELTDKAMNELYLRGFVEPDRSGRAKWPIDWHILPTVVSANGPVPVVSPTGAPQIVPPRGNGDNATTALEQQVSTLGAVVKGIDLQRQAEQYAKRIAMELLARQLENAPTAPDNGTRSLTDTTPGAVQPGKGEPLGNVKSKGVSRDEAEMRVRDWLLKHAKDNPATVTRDAVAAGTGVSTGQVSNTATWKAFRERRDAEAKPGERTIPLTDEMQAAIPADCATPAELAELVEEQEAERAEEERRHKRRHDPS